MNMSNTDTFLEKHVDLITSWTDDVLMQQMKFQMYTRNNTKLRQDHIRWLKTRIEENAEAREVGDTEVSTRLEDSSLKMMPDLEGRHDHLLMLAQIERYCNQLNEHIGTSLQKLTLVNQVNST